MAPATVGSFRREVDLSRGVRETRRSILCKRVTTRIIGFYDLNKSTDGSELQSIPITRSRGSLVYWSLGPIIAVHSHRWYSHQPCWTESSPFFKRQSSIFFLFSCCLLKLFEMPDFDGEWVSSLPLPRGLYGFINFSSVFFFLFCFSTADMCPCPGTACTISSGRRCRRPPESWVPYRCYRTR